MGRLWSLAISPARLSKSQSNSFPFITSCKGRIDVFGGGDVMWSSFRPPVRVSRWWLWSTSSCIGESSEQLKYLHWEIVITLGYQAVERIHKNFLNCLKVGEGRSDAIFRCTISTRRKGRGGQVSATRGEGQVDGGAEVTSDMVNPNEWRTLFAALE